MRPMLVAVLLAAALAIALTGGSAAAPSHALPTTTAKSPVRAVLGMSYKTKGGTLAWFNPLTLQTLRGRKVPLAGHTGSWAFSTDRSLFAIGNCDERDLPSIRFVNARSMRVAGDLRLSPGGDCISALRWLQPRRLLAVVHSMNSRDTEIVVVDPVARQIVRRTQIASSDDETVWSGSVATKDELVLLLGTYDSFVPARLAVVDTEGNVRVVTVERVLVGTVFEEESEDDHRARTIHPGFAVDPESRRAFLVPPSGPLAEIDVQTLSVSYRELEHPSLLRRFLRWLEPAAQAKGIDGPMRDARWLGEGMLAVSGTDYAMQRDAQGNEIEVGAPAGVTLVDTRSWRATMLSAGSSGFAVAPGLVIAQGGRWDAGEQRMVGPGILAFGLDGRERWSLPQPAGGGLDPAGGLGLGYVWLGQGRLQVVDLATGNALRTIMRNEQQNPWPRLLAAQSSDW